MKLSKTQTGEIKSRILFRLETLKNDPESADEFETLPALKKLLGKFKNPSPVFTEPEIAWIVEELENTLQITEDGMEGCTKSQVKARQKFMAQIQDAIDKLLSKNY